MRKKIISAGVAGICMAAVFTVTDSLYVKADEPETPKSQGNIIMEDFGEGSVALYSSDIYYLQEELNELFKELR